jgi:hypothetical protein
MHLPWVFVVVATLHSADSVIPLSPEQSAELSKQLEAYVRACHPSTQVVSGEEQPQEVLETLWAEQERTVHAILRETGGSREVIIGFPATNDGLGAVLSRAADKRVTSYAKCPGLDGLRLACRVHRLVPGGSRAPDARNSRR